MESTLWGHVKNAPRFTQFVLTHVTDSHAFNSSIKTIIKSPQLSAYSRPLHKIFAHKNDAHF